MDIDRLADEAAGRVLDVIERDGAIHRSRIARVIADEVARQQRQPYVMMAGPAPANWWELTAPRRHDPG